MDWTSEHEAAVAMVARRARKLGASAWDAEDQAQSAALALFERRVMGDMPVLVRTGLSAATDATRVEWAQRGWSRRTREWRQAPLTDDAAAGPDDAADLLCMLARLPRPLPAIAAYLIRGDNLREIAERMGALDATTHYRIKRIRKAVREWQAGKG